ncbi:sporulation protein [Bacillus phage BC-T25]|nr:sporulation protein [Bacillus phage BC-T25]
MSKIQTLHKAMQALNAAHKEAKGTIFEIIEELIKENSALVEQVNKLETKVKQLDARSGATFTGAGVTIKGELNPKLGLMAEDTLNNENDPETVTYKVDPEKVKAKQEEDERMSLVKAVVSEHLVKTADPTGENWQLHVETLSRLAEVVGITAKEGTAPNRIPVLLVAKDSTGSMGQWESYMAKCVTHWTKELLEVHYGKCVDARYINFDKNGGVECTFEECFIKGADGGTLISPAVKMLNTMADDYDYEERHDVYVLILSDGDNLQSDKKPMIKQLERLAPKTKKLWYVEMNQYNRLSNVLAAYKPNPGMGAMPENMSTHIIQGSQKVYVELFEMFQGVK